MSRTRKYQKLLHLAVRLRRTNCHAQTKIVYIRARKKIAVATMLANEEQFKKLIDYVGRLLRTMCMLDEDRGDSVV